MNLSPRKPSLPAVMRNSITSLGVLMFFIGIVILALFFLTNLAFESKTPYSDLIPIVIVPLFFLISAILVPVGMWRSRRRMVRSGDYVPRRLVIDFNNARHYNGVMAMATGLFTLISFGLIVGFRAYEFTESVTFCGEICHKVMSPQFTAYQNSPHARVKCVECHVGEGADYYVKSKMSGMYQVYSVLFHKYPTPITPPVHSLRPAQETCEHCHWPDNFFSGTQKTFKYYLNDSDNTEWTLTMLIKTGGGHSKLNKQYGIHLHMNIANLIEYKALDDNRQLIPWVRMTNKETGEYKTFISEDAPPKEVLDKIPTRKLDCMDCHNRPAHIFNSPKIAVNAAMDSRQIDPAFPDMVSQAVKALNTTYEEGLDPKEGIVNAIMKHYQQEQPDLAAEKKDSLVQSVKALEEIYANNFFPEMHVDWTVYPNNIGHRDFPGCFRCHDGKHSNELDETLPRECDTCHLIVAQGTEAEMEYTDSNSPLEFLHPEEIGGAWEFMLCTECHAPANFKPKSEYEEKNAAVEAKDDEKAASDDKEDAGEATVEEEADGEAAGDADAAAEEDAGEGDAAGEETTVEE